jgi:arginase family enzyme
VDEVYLHIDNDALDPAVAPGIVDEPVPGGLSLEQLEDVVDAVTARFRIRAATLATYTPERDEDERTLRAGLRVIELLGEP